MIAALTKLPTRTTRTVSAVTAGGILFVVVALVPQLADQIGELQELQELHESTGVGWEVPLAFDSQIEEQFQAAAAEFDSLQAEMIKSEQLPSIQNELLVIARECDCQIRRVAIQSGYSESWRPERPRAEVEPLPDVPNEFGETDEYNLQTELIMLSLTGTFEQISKFAQQVRSKPWLSRFSRMNLSRLPEEKGRLSMEATIAFSRLSRKEKPEFIDWHTTPSKPSVQ